MSRWFDQVRELTLRLVRAPSVTGTEGERDFSTYLHSILSELPYFQRHPEHLRIVPTTDDICERSNVYALVRGAGPATVVLAGHFDVVSIENYGRLSPWAFEPEQLLPRLIAELETEDCDSDDQQALDDLRTGDFMVGRGAFDMKSGLAIGIAVLARFAEQAHELPGSLLLVATPDEEENSYGMRSVAGYLPTLTAEWGVQLEAAINLDASGYVDDESKGRAVFLGTVGKLLPALYVVGRPTHAGAGFQGVNAALLAAEITRRIECNADLVDIAEGEAAPLPVCLKQIDLKDHYDVTTPGTCWCYYNVLTHKRSASDVLELVRSLALDAISDTLLALRDQARRYAQLSGRPIELPSWKPLVLTYHELLERLRTQQGEASVRDLERLAQTLAADPSLDVQTICLRLMETAWRSSGLVGPAVVIGFASLHYPRSLVGSEQPRERRLREVTVRQVARMSSERDLAIRLRPFFSGISDMSFLGGQIPPDDIRAVAANTPAWGTRLRVDYDAVSALKLPVINIGPWGNNYHQRTERVHMPYSFEVVPELIWRVVDNFLSELS